MAEFIVSFWEDDYVFEPIETISIIAKMPIGALAFALQRTRRKEASLVRVRLGEVITEYYDVKVTGDFVTGALTYNRAVLVEKSPPSKEKA